MCENNVTSSKIVENVAFISILQGRHREYLAGGVSILELPWKSSPRWVLDLLFWHLAHYHHWTHLLRNWNCKPCFWLWILFYSSSNVSTLFLWRLKKTYTDCREFPVRLENPHVISENQIWAGVVPVGPSGYTFNSSYRSRDSLEYKTELGNAIGMS